MELDSSAVLDRGGVAEAVIANRPQSLGKNMTQITPHELYPRKGHRFAAASLGTILPKEAHLPCIHRNDPLISDDSASDIGSQVFDRRGATAERLDVHAPGGAPNGGIDLSLSQLTGEMLAKGRLKQGQMEQEVGLGHRDDFARVIESCPGHEHMEVRMELKLLIPCVKNGGETVDLGVEALGPNQLLAQSGRSRPEEQVISAFGLRAEEEGSELGRQGEGDHEVGSANPFVEFPLDPLASGLAPTSRTGLVVAAMIGEVGASTLRAPVKLAAHDRSAAVLDGPDGPMLRRREDRILRQKLRQEATQHRLNGERQRSKGLAWQTVAKALHHLESIFSGDMGQMQINHGGSDLLMSQQALDGVEMSAGFEQVSREAVTQGMNRSAGDIELLTSEDKEALQ